MKQLISLKNYKQPDNVVKKRPFIFVNSELVRKLSTVLANYNRRQKDHWELKFGPKL